MLHRRGAHEVGDGSRTRLTIIKGMAKLSFVTVGMAAVIGCAGFLCFSARPGAAQESAVHLLVSNGMKGAMEELRPQCEQAIGHPLTLQFSSTAALKKRI